MRTEEIIGKTLTNIYAWVSMEVGGLDTGECFIELDYKYIIDIPFGQSDEIWVKELNNEAESLFADLSDLPEYPVSKDNSTAKDTGESYHGRKRNIFNRLRSLLSGQNILIKDIERYKVDYRENKLKHLKNKKVVDFIWYADDGNKGLLLLDNGYLITETTVAPHGTGLAGLNYFESLESLAESRGCDYLKLSDKKHGSH